MFIDNDLISIYLQNNPFMDGKFSNDVRQEKMSMVFGGWVNTVLGQKTWPCKRHQSPQLVTLFSIEI